MCCAHACFILLDGVLPPLAQAVEKYRDLLQLEQSMDELMEMIRDFSSMVFMQGPVVDMISKNVDQASNYVKKGVVELQKARKYQTKTRKVCCFVCLGSSPFFFHCP